MQLNNLFTDEDAVSPVIGVILMVAITVILAAVIGTMVLGIGDSVSGDQAPQASFSFDAQSDDTVIITHESGDKISSELTVKYTSSSTAEEESWDGSTTAITAGSSFQTSKTVDSDTTLRVVWTSDNGDSVTLGKFTMA